jgi:hypothetical protein
MDQTDDFEMKPLTPGLGFQKRLVTLKEHMAKTNLSQQTLRKSLPPEPPAEFLSESRARTSKEIIEELHEALKPLERQNTTAQQAAGLTEILPRDISDVRTPRSTPEITDNDSIFDQINFQITDKAMANEMGLRRGAHDNLVKPLTAVPVSFSSLFLDAAVVMAFSLIFLACLISVTKVDLFLVLRSSQNEFATQLSLVVLYFAVYEMYLIVARSFFGCTLGEWTFDLQMGEDEQISKAHYPALVLWRSILSLLTGIIVLPILSLAFGKDLAANLTGLQLYRKNQ